MTEIYESENEAELPSQKGCEHEWEDIETLHIGNLDMLKFKEHQKCKKCGLCRSR